MRPRPPQDSHLILAARRLVPSTFPGGEENSYVSRPSLRGLRCAYALTDKQRVLLLAGVPTRAAVLRSLLPAGRWGMQYVLFPAAAAGTGSELRLCLLVRAERVQMSY